MNEDYRHKSTRVFRKASKESIENDLKIAGNIKKAFKRFFMFIPAML
jgi:hypothetical protein